MTMSYTGGAPLLRDAPALDLANTHYAVRGKVTEGLGSAADLDAWLRAVLPDLVSMDTFTHAGPRDVARFIELRAAVRGVSAALTAGTSAEPAAVNAVNAAASVAPTWPRLGTRADGTLRAEIGTKVPELEQALAALAADAVDLFTGARAAHLRACQAPGCPLFFLKDHPRREWCFPACGARVRSTRAYRKRTAATA